MPWEKQNGASTGKLCTLPYLTKVVVEQLGFAGLSLGVTEKPLKHLQYPSQVIKHRAYVLMDHDPY